jgi:quinol monooxygenase YgiN
MIVEYIRYNLPEESRDAFEAAYAEAQASLVASPHCLGYELARCGEEPGRYTLRIEWDSAEGHMQGFRRGPDFPGFLAAVRPFIPHIEEMRHYHPTGVQGRKETAAASG